MYSFHVADRFGRKSARYYGAIAGKNTVGKMQSIELYGYVPLQLGNGEKNREKEYERYAHTI